MSMTFASYFDYRKSSSFNRAEHDQVVGRFGVNTLFDLVAPICIYHQADVCWRSRALKAARQLTKLALADQVLFNWLFARLSRAELIALQSQSGHSAQDAFLDVFAFDITSVYNDLFAELSEAVTESNATFLVDEYGSYGYKLGEDQFLGDSARLFPFYGGSADLVPRCQQLLQAA